MRRKLRTLYLVTFLVALHFGVPLYVSSTFLATYISETKIGLIFTFSAATGVAAFLFLPRLLKRFGNYRLCSMVLGAEYMMLIILAVVRTPTLAVAAFFFYTLLARFIPVHLDIFLEDASRDATTGGTRGLYLTALNLGIWLSPLVIGLLLINGDFWKIFLFAALLVVPISYMISKEFRGFHDPKYDAPGSRTLLLAARDPSIRRIAASNLLLYVFYAWMVIYMPLYLNRHLGFDWNEIGLLLFIMLIPFVVMQYPIGRIADRRIGEKEMLVIGFAIMSISSAAIPFIANASFWAWAAVLLITRIGAAMVEAMNEIYFFKHVTSKDAGALMLYRMTIPAGYGLGSLAGTVVLALFDFRFLFSALAVLLIAGIWIGVRLRDTR